jgi:pSer/pThr/pTyr-binding forkhead associated (FHA) protein
MAFILKSQSAAMPLSSFVLSAGKFVLGRSSKCDVPVKNDTVSRRHAELSVSESDINVRDLGSRNGTFVDDERISTATLQPGQRVGFGSVVFLLSAITTEVEVGSEVETTKRRIADPSTDIVQAKLSQAQRRVLGLILTGLSEKKVAARLGISPTTVHNHVQALHRAFKVHSRAELLVRLLKTTNGTS